MKPTVFTSFEQIDTQLEILAVERELSRYRMEKTVRDMGAPSIGGQVLSLAAPILRNLAINWLIRKLRERFRRDD